jgi:two-component system KDP operon response regulator KdpE
MRILVIDDDAVLVALLTTHLAEQGHETLGATTGAEGLRRALQFEPDLVLLDIGLPDLDGRQVCRQLRTLSDVPILFLSIRSDEADIVRGLSEGADGYIVKPFSLAELRARIAALRRRVQPGAALIYDDGRLHIDPSRSLIRLGIETVKLTPLEGKLLTLLLQQAGQVVPRQELVADLWDHVNGHSDIYLTTLIGQLRHKLGDDARTPMVIQTVYRVGYRFVPQPNAAQSPMA